MTLKAQDKPSPERSGLFFLMMNVNSKKELKGIKTFLQT